VWVLATAAALLVAGTTFLNLGVGDIYDSPQFFAHEWREHAATQCAHSSWARCRMLLEQAREIDPDGEQEESVRALRRAIADAGDSPPAPR
jgi:hypothetical protein